MENAYEKSVDIAKRLFEDLKKRGIEITNERGTTNLVILAIAEAMA